MQGILGHIWLTPLEIEWKVCNRENDLILIGMVTENFYFRVECEVKNSVL